MRDYPVSLDRGDRHHLPQVSGGRVGRDHEELRNRLAEQEHQGEFPKRLRQLGEPGELRGPISVRCAKSE